MCPVNKKEERKSTGAYISVPTHTTTTTTTAPKRNNNKKRSIHLEISRCKLIAPYHRCAALDIYSLGATHFLFSCVCVCLFVCFSSFERDSANADYPQTTDDVEEEEEEEGKVLHLVFNFSIHCGCAMISRPATTMWLFLSLSLLCCRVIFWSLLLDGPQGEEEEV
jgi:hypothetical protein